MTLHDLDCDCIQTYFICSLIYTMVASDFDYITEDGELLVLLYTTIIKIINYLLMSNHTNLGKNVFSDWTQSVCDSLNTGCSSCPSGCKHPRTVHFDEGELLYIIWTEACAILSCYNQLHY